MCAMRLLRGYGSLGAVLLGTLALTGLARAQVAVKAEGGAVTIANELVKVEYDLSRGRYGITDLKDPFSSLIVAHSELNELTSDTPGYKHDWSQRDASDELGKGKALTIRSTASGRPGLLLEFVVYEGKGCVALRSGVENMTSQPVLLSDIRPLTGARAFPRLATSNLDVKVLSGAAGGGETRVTAGPAAESPNNLLATVMLAGKRRSLVVGGLSYHEFGKYARTSPLPGSSNRFTQLQRLAPAGARLINYLDAGAADWSSRNGTTLQKVTGAHFRWQFSEEAAAKPYGDVLWDRQEILIQLDGLSPDKHYALGFSWWDYDSARRVESVHAINDGGGRKLLLGKQALPSWKKEQLPELRAVILPEGTAGSLKIGFRSDAPGNNAVVSEVWLYEVTSAAAKPWGPFKAEGAMAKTGQNRIDCVELIASDPVGRVVAPQTTYLPDDRFYVDITTPNPFEACEAYGLALRAATHARPNVYDFPTLCGRFVSDPKHGAEGKFNTTAGLIALLDAAAKAGFTKYARVGVRLMADTYESNCEQGWWDDAHWRKYGHYVLPYDTSDKWAKAAAAKSGVPLTYMQPGYISLDYVTAHPDHMLRNDISKASERGQRNSGACSYDYTDPAFREHLQRVYAQLKAAGVKGVMFEYPDGAWRADGGFEDKTATTVSAYRAVFELAREGLGPEALLEERNVAGQPFLDVTAGLVDSQRLSRDTDEPTPQMYAACGLRWYKNRVVYAYDAEAKNFARLRPAGRDGLRQVLTMTYLVAPRLVLATSFGRMTPEQVHDLSRIYPMHAAPKSPRPLDAFSGWPVPRVYDFAVEAGWHQLALYNPDLSKEEEIGVELGRDSASGGLALDPSAEYHVYDFWNDAYVGRLGGSERLAQRVRPGEVRMLSIHQAVSRPQFISTNRHVMQGYVDVEKTGWDFMTRKLTGVSKVVAGEPYKLVIATNGWKPKECSATGAKATLSAATTRDLQILTLERPQSASTQWVVEFEGK